MAVVLPLPQFFRRLGPPRADAELLAAFVERRDAEAFREIVQRYGPLVAGTCRRELGDGHAAEDATQNTFLALARTARSVRGDALPAWLFAVARRTCRKLHRTEFRRRRRETIAAKCESTDPLDALSVRELLAVLDGEVADLPERHRAVLLACYWQGETQAEAGRRLGLSATVVKGLLERGRQKLLARLARRGLSADVALRSLLIAPAAALAVSPALVARTVQSALAIRPAAFAIHIAGVLAALSTFALSVGIWLGTATEVPSPGEPKGKASVEVKLEPKVDALGDPLPDGAILRLGTRRFQHPSSSTDVVLSPDGKTVIGIGDKVIAWDTATGKEKWRGECDGRGTGYGTRPAAYLPDGRTIVTVGQGQGELRFWDNATGAFKSLTIPFKTVVNCPTQIRSIDVSPDGKRLAIGGAEGLLVCDLDGTVRFVIANINAGQLQPGDDRLAFVGHYTYARYSPDGRTLAVVTSENPKSIRLLEADSGKETRVLELTDKAVRMDFFRKSKRLAVTERDMAVRVYDTETGKRIWEQTLDLKNPYENYTSAVAVNPDESLVAIGATDNNLHLYEGATGKPAGKLVGHGWYPWGLAFTGDGKMLYSTGWEGTMRRWDVPGRKQLPLPVGIRGSAIVAASPDGRTLAYTDDSDTIRLVDATSGKEIRTIVGDGAGTSQLRFSPDGRRLAGGGSKDDRVVVAVWDLASGKTVHRWDWPKGRDPHSKVEGLSFAPDGSKLAAGVFRQNAGRVWDIASGKQLFEFAHKEVYGLSFTSDGNELATVGWDKMLRMWNVATGKVRREQGIVAEHGDNRMYTVSCSPRGGLLATAHLDGAVRIWTIDDLTPKKLIANDERFLFGSIEFSPDGLYVGGACSSGKIRLWDVFTGKVVWDRGTHEGNGYTVSFGRGSGRLLSGANDSVGYLWDLRPKDKSTKSPNESFDDLASTDAESAYRAYWALVSMPEKTVPLVAEKLRPAKSKVEPAQIQKWIADLDNVRFATRDAAQAGLSKLGALIGPELRAAVKVAKSDEQKSRLEKLVGDLAAADRNAEPRNLRIVSLLGEVNTPEAKALLTEWSKNDPAGPLGRIATMELKAMR